MHNRIMLGIAGAAFVAAGSIVIAEDAVRVLKLSPQDQRAVIRQADGGMRIVKVGDAVGESGVIAEIAPGRMVLERSAGQETELIIVHLDSSGQRVERMKRTVPKQAPLLTPGADAGKKKN